MRPPHVVLGEESGARQRRGAALCDRRTCKRLGQLLRRSARSGTGGGRFLLRGRPILWPSDWPSRSGGHPRRFGAGEECENQVDRISEPEGRLQSALHQSVAASHQDPTGGSLGALRVLHRQPIASRRIAHRPLSTNLSKLLRETRLFPACPAPPSCSRPPTSASTTPLHAPPSPLPYPVSPSCPPAILSCEGSRFAWFTGRVNRTLSANSPARLPAPRPPPASSSPPCPAGPPPWRA